MMRMIVGLLVIGMLAAGGAAWAQDGPAEADNQAQAEVVLMPQWYELDETGNQDSVREYDGRDFDLVDIGEFLLSGLNDDALYEILLRHPIAGDAEAEVLVDKSYWLSFEAMFNSLTHRFADDRNALVVNGVPTFETRVPWAPGDPRPSSATLVLDRLTAEHHAMERNEYSLAAGFTPAWMGTLRLVGSFWREDEAGDQILAFREEWASGSPELPSHKVRLTAPLDRSTTETEVGFDGGGGTLAYAYRHTRREFTNVAPPDLIGVHFDPAEVGPGALVTPNNHTDTDEADARAQVGEDAWLTASWSDRNRRNDYDGGTYDLRTLAASFAFRPSRDLHVVARWRDSDQDLNVVGPDSGDVETSRDLSVASLEARYYGIPRTVLRTSLLRRDVDRMGDRVGPEGFAENSTTDTFILGATHRPTPGLTLRVDWRHDSTDDPAINFLDLDEQPPRPVTVPAQTLLPYGGGLADDSNLLKASLTYAPNANCNLYADYRRLKEDRDEVSYHSEDKQLLAGGWAALSDRWSIHAEASRIEGDNGANWVVIGRVDENGTPDDPTDDIPLDLPWPPPEHVVYDYNSRVYSAGLTYLVSPKLRLFSNACKSTADGRLAPEGWDDQLTTSDVINGVSPLNVSIRKIGIGVAWTMDPMTNLIVEVGRERWTDHIDSTQTGDSDFVTLSMRKRM